MTAKGRVVVAMSGGVDSSVAAALLVEQGYEVIGLMMRLWHEPATPDGQPAANRCCTPDAVGQAQFVADQLNIPFYVVDTKQVFHDTIVNFFVDQYVSGVTPNPCIECNRHIRWEFLLNKALDLGATHLATGHYARLTTAPDGEIELRQAVDPDKDQSYVLHVLSQAKLRHALFPIGDYPKPEVRAIAAKIGLPTASRPDSQDLCFLSDNDYRRFLNDHAPAGSIQPGPILHVDGRVLGEHTGLPYYTIGQRKGLGIATGEPLFVVATHPADNALIVGPQAALGHDRLRAFRVNWTVSQPPTEPFRAEVKIRYRARPAPALVTPIGADKFVAEFDQPLRDITAGQGAVVYVGDHCLGGGIILRGDRT